MRVHSLCQSIFLLSLFFAPILADDKTAFQVVGTGECADCKDNNFETSQAFSGLHVTIDCKVKDGDMKRVASGELDKQGKFEVSLPKEVVNGQKLKHECYAQLHSAAAIPCPAHGGLEASKIVFKSVENGKHVFAPSKNVQFSAGLCTSKFLWPKFNFPPLPKTHPWLKNFGHPWSYPPLPPLYKHPIFPPIPIYKHPFYKPLPPPVPIYKPPVVKPLPPPVPIYKPPLVKPLPPPVPIYKPPVIKPLPPPVPIYKPPVVKPLPPPIPVYKPPKKPCPPTKPKPPKKSFPLIKPKPPVKPPMKPCPPTKPKPSVYKPPVYKPPLVKPLPPPVPIYKPPIVKPLPPPVPIYKAPIVKPLPPPVPIYKPPFYKKPCPPIPQLPPLPKLPPFPPKYYKHPKWGHFPPISPAIPHA